VKAVASWWREGDVEFAVKARQVVADDLVVINSAWVMSRSPTAWAASRAMRSSLESTFVRRWSTVAVVMRAGDDGEVRIWDPVACTPLAALRVAGRLPHLVTASTTIAAAGYRYLLALWREASPR
jgi:hypothetical protein